MASMGAGMRLEALLRGLRTTAVRGPVDRIVTGIAYDSRQVRRGFLFVAIPGTNQDGMGYAEDALARGAVAVVSQSGGPSLRDATHVTVPDARQALADLACGFHQHPAAGLRIAGVTGTNGKTTVTFMLRGILTDAGLAPGLIGTVRYEIGAREIPASRTTPESLDLQDLLAQMRQAGCRSAVMEVSSHALALERVRGIDFDVAVFTNLTRDHLDFHGTRERYFAAKKTLFDGLGRGAKPAVAVVGVDDRAGRALLAAGDIATPIVTFGCSRDAAVRAVDVTPEDVGSAWTTRTPWGDVPTRIPMAGRYNVLNALAALAAAGALGIAPERAAASLARLASVPGRLEEVRTGRGFRVFVDYAHTDDALGNVLKTLRPVTAGRLIVVFGCGGNRDRTKRPLMGAKADRLADYSIVTSDNPRREEPAQILAEIRAGFGSGARCVVIEDRGQAIQRAIQIAEPGDIVLVAGKGHETYQEFANRVVPFDDRQAVQQALAALTP